MTPKATQTCESEACRSRNKCTHSGECIFGGGGTQHLPRILGIFSYKTLVNFQLPFYLTHHAFTPFIPLINRRFYPHSTRLSSAHISSLLCRTTAPLFPLQTNRRFALYNHHFFFSLFLLPIFNQASNSLSITLTIFALSRRIYPSLSHPTILFFIPPNHPHSLLQPQATFFPLTSPPFTHFLTFHPLLSILFTPSFFCYIRNYLSYHFIAISTAFYPSFPLQIPPPRISFTPFPSFLLF
jgi:hypothetical protein